MFVPSSKNCVYCFLLVLLLGTDAEVDMEEVVNGNYTVQVSMKVFWIDAIHFCFCRTAKTCVSPTIQGFLWLLVMNDDHDFEEEEMFSRAKL
jgi:hypothetical protein